MIVRPHVAEPAAPAARGRVRRGARAAFRAVVAAGLAAAAAAVPTAAAAQGRPEIPPCPDNLLVDPGMEEGFGLRGAFDRLVPIGWQPWYAVAEGTTQPPRFAARRAGAGDAAAADGLWSAEMATEGANHEGGLWQRVSVEPGLVVEASIWAHAWASNGARDEPSNPPGTYALALGVDPVGGEDPASPRIAWSRAITVTDAWLPLATRVTSEGGAVTVFARGQSLAALAGNASRWDAACLRVTGLEGEPPWPAPPRPRPTATLDPAAPQPTEDPADVARVAVILRDGLAESAAALGDAGPMAVGVPATLAAIGTRVAASPTPPETNDEPAPRASAVIAERAGWFTLALAALAAGVLIGLGRGGPA